MFIAKKFDGQNLQAEEMEGQALLPYSHVLSQPMISIGAVVYFKGTVWPVKGPLPTDEQKGQAWLLFLNDHFQVIQGMPRFQTEAKEDYSSPSLMAA